MYSWKVVPLCEKQLRDVNSQDVLNNGLYRKCNTYKGGGGYDQFPAIYSKRVEHFDDLNNQFVVQLYGCPLKCPYCYVTQDGVFGKHVMKKTEELIEDFEKYGCRVFHLMGGAPAIYMHQWYEILDKLPRDKVFHSDLLLLEKPYSPLGLAALSTYKNSLYAVSIKEFRKGRFKKLTNTELDTYRFWKNLDILVNSNLNYYFTFTGMDAESVEKFKKRCNRRYNKPEIFDDSFTIELVHYKALD